MKRLVGTVTCGVVLLMSAAVALAQEPSASPAVTVDTLATEVVTDVPTPGSLGDFMQRFNERMQLLMTRDQERKASLELKFNSRRETQLEKCNQLTDEEHKDKCLERVSRISEKLLQRLENRAEHLQNQREALKEKIEAARQRRQERLQNLQQRLQEKRENVQQNLQQRRENVQQRIEERRDLRQERVENRQERREERLQNLQELRQGRRGGEDDDEDEMEDEDEDKMGGGGSPVPGFSPMPRPSVVQGASTYPPDLLEVVENFLDTVFGK